MKPDFMRRMAVVLLIALLAPALSACKEQAAVGDEPVLGGTYAVALAEEPKTLNPFKAASAAESTILANINSPLIYVGFEGEFAPGLAESWTTSEDGLTWTFTFRDDVYFHCGEKMTAADVAWTWNKAINEPGPMMTEYFSGIKSVEATDDVTMVVHFDVPNGAFLTQLRSAAMTGPYCPHCFEELGEDGFAKKPCAVGAFKIGKWTTGQSIVLDRNDQYTWGPSWVHAGPAYIEHREFKIIVDQATRLAALESGELTATGIPAQFWDKYENDERFYVLKGVSNFVAYVILNTGKAPFDDVRVRRAFGLAVDRDTIVTTVLEGRGRAAYTPIHPKLPGYEKRWETEGWKYDTDLAKSLLAEAGWVDTNNNGTVDKDGEEFKIDFWVMPGTNWNGAADVMKTTLKEVGIEINIVSYEIGTMMEYMTDNQHVAGLFGWTWSGDPLQILKMVFHSSQMGGGLNYSMYSDPEMDALIDNGRQEMDQDKRLEAVRAVVQKAWDDAIYIPVYHTEYMTCVSKVLQGVKMHPFLMDMIMHDTWLAPEGK